MTSRMGERAQAASRGGRTLVDGMQHISEDDLLLYALDMFTSDGAIAIEEHLLWCEACLDRLELLDARIGGLRKRARPGRTN